MPRGPRLDAPGALHHVVGRGIEQRSIFLDDEDREDFLRRLGRLVEVGALAVFAWALMPNHFHLLLRTGVWPLERAMRALLAGYATCFNRRYERAGHLFQNRYRSTLCEDDEYFLKLVSYIHLNPIPSVVSDLAALAGYPYTGHSVLLGRTTRTWQDTEPVLGYFAEQPPLARTLYEEFIRQSARAPKEDLEGGGLIRSASEWRHVNELRNGRERFKSDERILGSSAFAERMLRELSNRPRLRLEQERVIEMVCRAVGVDPEALAGEGRARAVSRARRGIAYLWIAQCGGSGRAIATLFGLNPASIYEAARRGRGEADYWLSIVGQSARREEPDKP